ncbi:hypothetical protein GCM10009626_14090 [Brachybacterium sacelli]
MARVGAVSSAGGGFCGLGLVLTGLFYTSRGGMGHLLPRMSPIHGRRGAREGWGASRSGA